MTLRIAILILTGSGLALTAPPPEAPRPNLIAVYRANSDPALPPLPSRFSYSVGLFAFSPDEQWLAVVLHARAMQSGKTPVPDCALLLLPLQGGDSQRIRIDPCLGASLLWPPDSKSVVIQRNTRGPDPAKIYNLRGELIWTGPPSGLLLGFIAPGRLLAMHERADGRLAGFDTLDIRAQTITPWRAPKHGNVAAIDSERGLLAMFPDAVGSKTLIVDYAAGKAVQSVRNQDQVNLADSSCHYDEINTMDLCMDSFMAPRVYFAEGGKTLCQAALVGEFKSHPVCQDVDTGKTIAEFRGFSGGAPAAASARGSRMVLTNLNSLPSHWGSLKGDGGLGVESYGSRSDPGPGGVQSGLGVETYGSRVVWDFRSGTEVAAWAPFAQRTAWLLSGQPNGRSAPAVAISSFGHYVAEAIGDELHIYQIP